jgi:hypothetical protein
MKYLSFFVIVLFLSNSAFSQKKVNHKKKIAVKKVNKAHALPILYANYVFVNYQPIVKSKLKKKHIAALNNCKFSVTETGINSSHKDLDALSFSVFELEKMKKDDYLFRCFKTIKEVILKDVPLLFTVHKTDNQNFFGIIQLLNGQIVFPYKGGLIYAKRIAN